MVNNTAYMLSTNGTTRNFTIQNFPDGRHYWNVTCQDGTYSNTSALRSFVVDTTPPSISMDAPGNGYNTSSSSVNFNWTMTDLNSSALCNITIDGAVNNTAYMLSTNATTRNLTVQNIPDGTHYWNVTCHDGVYSNTSATIYFKVDTTAPAVNITYPFNYTRLPAIGPTRLFNWTASDAYLSACWYHLNDNATNVTVSCSANSENTTIIKGIYNNITFYANDTVNNLGVTRISYIPNTLPNPTNITLEANSSSKIYNNLTFRWNASTDGDGDTVSYNIQIATDYGFSSLYTNALTNSTSFVNYSIPNGTVYWRVRTYDGYEYSAAYSDIWNVDVIQARVNITEPANNKIVYPGNVLAIRVEQANRSEWLDNFTVTILNDDIGATYNMTNLTAEENSTMYYNYSIASSLTPRTLTVIARGYNGTESVNDTISVKITRTVGPAVTAPRITEFTTYPTYTTTGTSVNVSLIASLDTIIESIETTLSWPNGTVQTMSPTYSNYSSPTLVYRYNYTFTPTMNGNYLINTTLVDINQLQVNRSIKAVANDSVAINMSSVGGNFTLRDISTNIMLASGPNMTFNITPGQYNMEIANSQFRIIHKNVTVNESYGNVFSYTNLDESTAPTDTRAIDRFQISSNLTFEVSYIIYNYTNYLASVTHESNLGVYKCASEASCTWSALSSSVDESANTVNATFSNMSVFILEESTATTTVPVSTPAAAVGGGTSNIPVILTIVMPGPILMGLADRVDVPVNLINEGETDLNGIKLSAVSNTEDITPEISMTSIPWIKEGKKQNNITLTLTSHSTPGNYDVTVFANVSDPELNEYVKLLVTLAADLENATDANRTLIMDKIKFIADLFKENPECLELQELIGQAEIALDNNETAKAMALMDAAINGCRDLVTSAAGHKTIRELAYSLMPKSKIIRWAIIIAVSGSLFWIVLMLLLIKPKRQPKAENGTRILSGKKKPSVFKPKQKSSKNIWEKKL